MDSRTDILSSVMDMMEIRDRETKKVTFSKCGNILSNPHKICSTRSQRKSAIHLQEKENRDNRTNNKSSRRKLEISNK
jgi:hypothetical protein